MIERFPPGYMGLSYGEVSINVIIIDSDGDPCFFQVSEREAYIVQGWMIWSRDPSALKGLLPDLDEDDRELLAWAVTHPEPEHFH